MTNPDRRTFLHLAAASAATLALPAKAQELGLEAVGGALALKVRTALETLPAGREGNGAPLDWLDPGTSITLQVTGRGGVPAGATASKRWT